MDNTPADLAQETIRRYKLLVDNLGKLFHSTPVDTFQRASGLVICPKCGLCYFDHPQCPSGFFMSCDGQLLKL